MCYGTPCTINLHGTTYKMQSMTPNHSWLVLLTQNVVSDLVYCFFRATQIFCWEVGFEKNTGQNQQLPLPFAIPNWEMWRLQILLLWERIESQREQLPASVIEARILVVVVAPLFGAASSPYREQDTSCWGNC
jgi:hypothetical protein